ncbi:hypothetical protein HZH66_012906 [Vespula vulgaris]|uniref:Uncharacterized protein n=1 Tax=Vespula vulgaris TaxID=7454 RepID=A0A834J7T6_VESVU|nr:hypothetical protein HZH66_012906 [Vespula vulgaris]
MMTRCAILSKVNEFISQSSNQSDNRSNNPRIIIDKMACAAIYIGNVDQLVKSGLPSSFRLLSLVPSNSNPGSRQRRPIESRSLRRCAAADCRCVERCELIVGVNLRGLALLVDLMCLPR